MVNNSNQWIVLIKDIPEKPLNKEKWPINVNKTDLLIKDNKLCKTRAAQVEIRKLLSIIWEKPTVPL